MLRARRCASFPGGARLQLLAMPPAQVTAVEPQRSRKRRITPVRATGLVAESPARFQRGLVRRPRLVNKLLAARRGKRVAR